MKHGRAIIPEPSGALELVFDPEGDMQPYSRVHKGVDPSKFRPTANKAVLRNGTVVSERATLDGEGQAWLKIALNEFRDNPCWEWSMSLTLIRATLFGVPGFREEKNAATDEAANDDSDES